MRYLAIDKEPYALFYAIFDDKTLSDYGMVSFLRKDENERVDEIWNKVAMLLDRTQPTFVITHLLDLRYTPKKKFEKMVEIKTILRKMCLDRNIIYHEFRTYGWEKRITHMKKPSPKAKLDVAKEYDETINNVNIANAIILGEGVAYKRLQIGSD